MKWLFRWLGQKISNAQNDIFEESKPHRKSKRSTNLLLGSSDSNDIRTDPITFKMYRANGGWAIEFSHYDNRADKWDSTLYVVNDEQELGTQISQIITMEALRR